MSNHRKDFDRCVRKILLDMEKGEINVEDDDLYLQCLKYCIDQNYISGIACSMNVLGKPIFQMINPKIELAGLDLLHPRINIVQAITCGAAIVTAIATAGTLVVSIVTG